MPIQTQACGIVAAHGTQRPHRTQAAHQRGGDRFAVRPSWLENSLRPPRPPRRDVTARRRRAVTRMSRPCVGSPPGQKKKTPSGRRPLIDPGRVVLRPDVRGRQHVTSLCSPHALCGSPRDAPRGGPDPRAGLGLIAQRPGAILARISLFAGRQPRQVSDGFSSGVGMKARRVE
jgi:hypothetical protein